MRLGLRLKLFLFVPVVALLPWLGYQTYVKLDVFVVEAQAESMRVLAETLRAELDALPPSRARASRGLAVEPFAEPSVIDGFMDDWPAINPVLSDERLSLYLGQYDQMVTLVAEIRDPTRFYREPLFGRAEAVPFDAVRIRQLSDLQSQLTLATEAPGGFSVAIETEASVWAPARVMAHWWEIAGGYRLEWRMPVRFFTQGFTELTVVDHNWASPVREVYRFRVEPLDPGTMQLARRLAGDTRQLMVVDAERRLVAKTAALPELPGLMPSDIELGNRSSADFLTRVIPVRSERGETYQVVVRSPRSSVIGGAQQALVTLGWQTLGVLAALVVGLSVFSGRLAERIGRLRRELKSYLDVRGRLQPVPRLSGTEASDEVGDLARDIGTVLADLNRYTAFLERIPRTLKHELSNPMSAIQTSLELLAEETDPVQIARLRATAERGIQKLESTLAQVTEAASLEEALRDDGQAPFDLVGLTEQALDSMRLSAPDRRWELDAPMKTLWVLGNDLRFEQLLDKVFDNARDFTPIGGRVQVSIRDQITSVSVAIENEGPALTEQALADAFQLFSGTRNDASGQHLGLGLYVVRLIAESMGATVSLTNTAQGVSVLITGLRVPG